MLIKLISYILKIISLECVKMQALYSECTCNLTCPQQEVTMSNCQKKCLKMLQMNKYKYQMK